MHEYREDFIHLLYAIILTQFVVIAIFVGGYSNQYMADDYFRAWINNNYPGMGFMLQGQFGALLVGMALGATVLIIQHMRRDEELKPGVRPLLAQQHVSSGGSDISDGSFDSTDEASKSGTRADLPSDVLAELEKSD